MRRTAPFPDAFVVEEARMVAELQRWLLDLNTENIDATRDVILQSVFVENKDRVSQLARNVFLIGECRPFSIPIISDMCQSLATAMQEESQLKHHFLRALSMPPTRHSAHLFLLRQLMYRNLISPQDVIHELNRFLNSHPDRIEDMLSTFCIFAPEIEKWDKPLFDSILSQFKTMCKTVYLPPELTLLIDKLEFLRANNWKFLIERADFGFNPEPISVAIKDDDISTLRTMSKSPSFDKDQRIHPSVFERCMFLWNEPTLLQLAAFHGSVKCFRFLLELGADMTICANNGFTTPCFAIAGGQLEIIQIMNEMHVSFDGALQTAALMHQQVIFEWLFENIYEKKNEALAAIDPHLGSVLHAAASSNNTHIIIFCLARGVDVNIPNRIGCSPLHLATERTRMDAIALLVQHTRININARDENDESPLHVAAENGRYKPAQILVKHRDIDVNAKDKFDRTPLHFGAQEGYSKAIKVILAQPGVNVNARDEDQATPLHCAAHNGRWDAIRILCQQKDILVNVQDEKGWTPLHYAAQAGYSQVVRYLLAHPDIQVNIQDNDGWSPLHFAIQEGQTHIVRILLNHPDIDVNIQYQDGWTPLHSAVQAHSLDDIMLLMSHEKIIKAPLYNGKVTPYDLAVSQKFTDIAEFLASCK